MLSQHLDQGRRLLEKGSLDRSSEQFKKAPARMTILGSRGGRIDPGESNTGESFLRKGAIRASLRRPGPEPSSAYHPGGCPVFRPLQARLEELKMDNQPPHSPYIHKAVGAPCEINLLFDPAGIDAAQTPCIFITQALSRRLTT